MKDLIDNILQNEHYQKCYGKIEKCEKKREFCHHDMNHFMDVARIAMILNLEEGLQIDKELIYATALLHDIGRHKQYKKGIPHEIASAKIAEKILLDCGCDEQNKKRILQAIRNHRDPKMREEANLCGIIYRADKMSRACFACKQEKNCNWDIQKKNLTLTY